jgi:hypothetical protein
MVFTCPHYQKNDEFHQDRLRVAADLVGLRYGARLSKVLDDLVSSTPGMPSDIYKHSLRRDCRSGDCFVVKYLPALLASAGKQVRDDLSGSVQFLKPNETLTRRYKRIVELLSRLAEIGRYYDEANARCAKKTAASEKIKNKLDLYRVASETSGAVSALLQLSTKATATMLMDYAPFLAKFYLSILAHSPEFEGAVSELNPERKSYQAQRKELEGIVTAAGIKTRYSTGPSTGSRQRTEMLSREALKERAKEILDAQIEEVKSYSMVQLIRLGAIYIAPIRGTFSDAAKRQPIKGADFSHHDMVLIYDEMSNVGNAILSVIYTITNQHMETLYGRADSQFALLLGGANARKEFPSFDYDAIAVYEKEGSTSGGVLGKISHKEYFNELFRLIMETANDVGHHFDDDFQKFLLNVTSRDNGLVFNLQESKQRMGSGETQMLRSGMVYLTLGAGDADLGSKIMQVGEKMLRDETLTKDDVAWSYARRVRRREKNRNKWYNVKLSAGGLRDINDAVWIDNAIHQRAEGNLLRGIDNLPLEHPEKRRLKESYLYLMNLRVRLDFYYGRNNKDLPLGKELERFVKALGYEGDSAVADFRKDYHGHRRVIRSLTDGAIDSLLGKVPGVEQRVKFLTERENTLAQDEMRAEREAREAIVLRQVEERKIEIEKRGGNPLTSDFWARFGEGEQGF